VDNNWQFVNLDWDAQLRPYAIQAINEGLIVTDFHTPVTKDQVLALAEQLGIPHDPAEPTEPIGPTGPEAPTGGTAAGPTGPLALGAAGLLLTALVLWRRQARRGSPWA
jgi:hypothetical protein